MNKIVISALLLALYGAVIIPFTAHLNSRPYVEKMGYIPSVNVLRFMSADQELAVGASLVMKVLFYFGGLVDSSFNKLAIPPDHPAMSRAIHTAVKLDPYNMDAYYFAQAVLVWDVQQVELANGLLDYGMQYRDWDFYLPFFAGFNNAFFLKDYDKAARYYQRAAELTGSELFSNLAGRYLYESGQTRLGIAYLKTMEQATRSESVKKSFQLRIAALSEVERVELARGAFVQREGRMPRSLDELLTSGFLDKAPVDPYGGDFFLAEDGAVRSTSQFAVGTMSPNNNESK